MFIEMRKYAQPEYYNGSFKQVGISYSLIIGYYPYFSG